MGKQYAVFGLGTFGVSVALTLENLHCEVIVVDNSAEKIHEIADKVSYAIHADIQDPEVIKDLGARNLDGVIVAVAENLEASIMATILAKEAGIPYVLAKVLSPLHADILKKVGADEVAYPEREMGSRVARSLVSTDFADWIELSPTYSIIEAAVPREWVGKCLKELETRVRYRVNIVGVIEEGQVKVALDPDEIFRAGAILILIGANKDLQKIVKM